MKFKESALAHKYLDGLGQGLEIGGSSHNPFGLRTRNVDTTRSMDTIFKNEEFKLCGEKLPVDIVAYGDDLPMDDGSVDFVVSSHVIEHFFDPIKAIEEWMRVVKPGGYVFIICPHKDRIFDKDRPRTKLAELIDRHSGKIVAQTTPSHYSVWIMQDVLDLCAHMGLNVVESQDPDDKVGNGFAVVLRKP